MLLLLAFFIPLCVIAQPGAQENSPPASISVTKDDLKELKFTGSGRVETVIDGQTIALSDGRIIRLSGVFYPWGSAEMGREDRESLFLGLQALQTLLPKGTEIHLYQTRQQQKGRMNRMGQTLAHVVVKSSMVWVNGTLVARGLAYALNDAQTPELMAPLYGLEQQARSAEIELWAKDGQTGLLTPESASKVIGMLRVIEGRVQTAASRQNMLYLNFGDDWKKDFTVQITPPVRKALLRAGIDPLSLSGQTVRVRGWIRDWNGPFMELTTVHNLEVVEGRMDKDHENGAADAD
jgi:micrococcal nuclease